MLSSKIKWTLQISPSREGYVKKQNLIYARRSLIGKQPSTGDRPIIQLIIREEPIDRIKSQEFAR